MPCECLNYGYAPEMGPHVEGHHLRCPRVAELQPGQREFIVSEEKKEEAAKRQRRPMAPSLEACHKISGILDDLDEEDMPWVLGWLCGQYAPPDFAFNTKTAEAKTPEAKPSGPSIGPEFPR